jgi:hypothetical protein
VISDDALDVLDDDVSHGILSIFEKELSGAAVLSFAASLIEWILYTRLTFDWSTGAARHGLIRQSRAEASGRNVSTHESALKLKSAEQTTSGSRRSFMVADPLQDRLAC